MEPWRALDAYNGEMWAQIVQWRVCRPVVAADFHYFDEEQDPDAHQSEVRPGSRSASK
jgi:hypothetical protein